MPYSCFFGPLMEPSTTFKFQVLPVEAVLIHLNLESLFDFFVRLSVPKETKFFEREVLNRVLPKLGKSQPNLLCLGLSIASNGRQGRQFDSIQKVVCKEIKKKRV